MKQVARVLSTYSADLFGICSVLYELGGLVVMHDASGCNSTYNTHDEPRWYDIESMIYISGLIENDVILGNDEKLISDVIEAASETQPKFIAISAALIPLFMSTDMKGIARIIEKRTGIPTFGFTTNAMDTYVLGGNMVYREFLGRFCPNLENIPTSTQGNSLSVNLLGVTPLDFSIVGNVEALKEYFKDCGIEVNCCMTMGCTVEEMANAHKADVNVVCSSMALDGARILNDKYEIPAVLGLPMGKTACCELEKLIRESASDGKTRVLGSSGELSSIPALEHQKSSYTLRDRAKGGTWIIGEAINAAGIRYVLEHDLGITEVHILCPTQVDAHMLRDGDVMVRDESDIEKVLKDAKCVIADPIYRRILTRDENGNLPHFINIPHEAYSGRMYRSHIPVFIGDCFTGWLYEKMNSDDESVGINDIMKINEPYKINI